MKKLILKTMLILIVGSTFACSKVRSNSSWLSVNKSNVEQCWRTNVANIRMDNSWFDFDDEFLELRLQIADSSGRILTFENGNLFDDEPLVDGNFVSFSDFELTDMIITVDAQYRGPLGEAIVYCSPFKDGSVEIEIGRALF